LWRADCIAGVERNFLNPNFKAMSMFYHPEKYKIPDRPMENFIDEEEIETILEENRNPSKEQVREVINRSLGKHRLSLKETAILLNANDPDLIEDIKNAARQLKENVYGKRIVLFAPLYIGNYCTNDCSYCGFRVTNRQQERCTLTKDEIVEQVTALEDNGHKRLILVYRASSIQC